MTDRDEGSLEDRIAALEAEITKRNEQSRSERQTARCWYLGVAIMRSKWNRRLIAAARECAAEAQGDGWLFDRTELEKDGIEFPDD